MAEAPKPPPPPPPKVEPEPEPEPVPEPEPEPPKEPEPPPSVVVTAEKIELDRTVQFESGKAKLVDDSKTLLGDVAKVLTEHPEILLVQIEGHTDAVGSNRKNKKLSVTRANAVRAFLIKEGIAKKRLVAKGFGEDKPTSDNGTEEGRFKNRRVDLKILKRDESAVEEKKKSDDEVDDAAEKKPVEKKEKKPAKKAPVEEEEAPVEKKPAEKKPAKKAQVEEEEAPVEKKPAEKKPAAKKPVTKGQAEDDEVPDVKKKK